MNKKQFFSYILIFCSIAFSTWSVISFFSDDSIEYGIFLLLIGAICLTFGSVISSKIKREKNKDSQNSDNKDKEN